MAKKGRKKFYSANAENVRVENEQKGGGTFYLDLPDHIELWSPQVGDNYIRILPSCDPDFNIWFHVWFHYNPSSKSYFLCPKKMSPQNDVSPCPVCEEYTRLDRAGEPDDVCQPFKAQAKTLFFIIDRDDQKKGVQLYSASRWMVAVDIFAGMHNRRKNIDYDIADIDEGYDIQIYREGKGRNTKYKAVIDKEESCPIGFDSWENEIVSFAEVLADEQPYNVIKADFFGGGGEEEDEDEDERTARKSKRKDLSRSSKSRGRHEEDYDEDGDNVVGSGDEDEDVPHHDPPPSRGKKTGRRVVKEEEEEEEEEDDPRSRKKDNARDRLKKKLGRKR